MARLLLFGPAREAAGVASAVVPAYDVAGVLAWAETAYGPAFVQVLRRSRVWLNGDGTGPEAKVGEHDEVAVLPPVSGG